MAANEGRPAATGSGENLIMKKHALKLTSLIAMALAVTLLGPPRAAADDDDPPSRVARLSVADGSVSFQPAGTQDWVGAVVNRPMTALPSAPASASPAVWIALEAVRM